MKKLLTLLLLVLTLLSAAAKKQSVGPSRLKKDAPATDAIAYDTIVPAEGEIRCSGYDKPNRATRETMFLTNLLSDSIDIDAVNLTLDYFDLNDRQLHSATHTIFVHLPAGQTRSVSVPSWDRNNAFHYHLSPAPQRRPSSPYTVRSRLNFLLRRP